MNSLLQSVKQSLFSTESLFQSTVRWASKKTSGSTRNKKGSGIKKHRGWKRQDGSWVESGTLLVTQLTLRFHPGLNVGMGRNGTLYAKVPGRVMVTCEKTDLNWDHKWVERCYANRSNTPFYKKYFNVVPETQHQNFVLKDQI